MIRGMNKLILGVIFMFLFYGTAFAGILFGRIIKEDGRPLAKTKITIQGEETVTNEFGGYKVKLNDGEDELSVVIDNTSYTSERILIYSPETKQNWRIDPRGKKLIKINGRR
jgi:hypothetical protein